LAFVIWIIKGFTSMPLSPTDKQRILDMLDQLERGQLEQTLSSTESFGSWLKSTLYSVYVKVKDALSNLWKTISQFFS